MSIEKNISLLGLNTFGIDAKAEHFASINSIEELRGALSSKISPVFILGGGSNILLTGNVKGLVLKNNIRGMEIVRRFKNKVWVKVGGGEKWHDFTQWAVNQGLGGVENMSLIPGTVGAAPIQNIGAYGSELKDVFVKLEAANLQTLEIQKFTKPECKFGYRESIFKKEGKGKFFITSVTFSLSLKKHKINTNYGDIQKTLAEMGVEKPGIREVSQAVIKIRTSKLPDPSKIGNSGSFFKNPEIARPEFDNLLKINENAPHYDLPDGRVKIPAGWLIEQCGWKGKRVGNTGAYEKQALVLVNYGGASGEEVWKLALEIIASVKNKFGIRIEPEVNII